MHSNPVMESKAGWPVQPVTVEGAGAKGQPGQQACAGTSGMAEKARRHLMGSDCVRLTASSTPSMRSAAAAAASASSCSRACSLPRMTAVSFSCL